VLAVLAVVTALHVGRPVLMPLVAGIVVGFILGPIAERANSVGIPTWLANLSIVATLGAAVYGVAIFVVPAIADVITRAPELSANVREKLSVFERSLATLAELSALFAGGGAPSPSVRVEGSETAMITSVLATVTPALAEFVVFAFALILFLAGRKRMKNAIVLSVQKRANRLTTLKVFSGIETTILAYFATVTAINAGVAVMTGLALFVVGVPGAPIWAVLAFVFNFLPVVGPLILKAMLLITGILFMPNLLGALVPMLLYILITSIESNFVTPRVVGARLTVEPLVLFVCIVFFTWMWGPVGAFLSNPLVIAALIVRDRLKPADATSPALPDAEPSRASQR
jgi:predicted PurR-regulated permease PerM